VYDYAGVRFALQTQQASLIEALGDLVTHESPSLDKPLLDLLARRLAQRFEAQGAEVHVLSQAEHGNHVSALYAPRGIDASAPPALLLCHFDTVWDAGTLAKRPFSIREGRAYGPGTFDMKGGIVIAEGALRAIKELRLPLRRAVKILLNSDEEIGSRSSRAWIEAEARKAAYVLVLEPALPDGSLKTARKGVGAFHLEIEGRAAHAGLEPEKGVSAIEELAHQIVHLHGLNDFQRGTTVNVGVVRGGARSNIVAAHAEAEIDVRAWTEDEAVRMEALLLGLRPFDPAVRLSVRGGFEYPPMERTSATAGLAARAKEIGRTLGLELHEGAAGGGSDGNYTAALGVPTLDGLGPVGDGAHAEHEHVVIESLAERAALLAALLCEL